MNKSVIMKTIGVIFSLLACISCSQKTKEHLQVPNILFILADDLGYGDIACYNPESRVPTPNLDKLAGEGIRFTDAHSPSTVCTPSRYSLLTGSMAFRTGFPGVFTGAGGPCLIGDKQLTLPGMLRDHGYTTACVGKWHVGLTFSDVKGQPIHKNGLEAVQRIDYNRPITDAPIHRGFDYFYGTACCPTTDYLYAFIDGDRIPVPPEGLLDREPLPDHVYSNDNRIGMIAPGFDLEEVDMIFLEKSKEFLEKHKRNTPDKPFFLFHSTQAVHLPSFPGKDFKERTQAGPHGDFIFELDFIVGSLMKVLDSLGLAENTLVMFSSDNGPETTSVINMRRDYGHDGANPWRGMKRDQWEGGHRIPFIVRWTGHISEGSVSSQTVCLTDIMATCAEIVGADLPEETAEDSYSILPVFLGEQAGDIPIRQYTLHQTNKLELAIRNGPWKYLDHQGSGGNNYTREKLVPYALQDTAPDAPGQLYNLQDDPGETNNLFHKHQDIADDLKEQLNIMKD